ncbi:MAG TPA: M23 family metallopeptidase [Polyangiaceae bacterium]|nr:M23 family metallopeptidase [Polyangiaceae bacterium]
MPKHWQPRTAMKCTRLPGVRHKMCDGPRRTPEPYGADALKAETLGLGQLDGARKLLREPPPPEWVRAVRGRARPNLLWPIEDGSFGRGFGYVRKERRSLRHNGVDVGAPVGDLVRALNDGIVAYSDNGIRGFGNAVVVVHKDASVSFYCHQRANYVFAGQQVRRGQVVGEVGVTGFSRGPHLHFEWHSGGDARDPMRRMVGQPERRQHTLAALSPLWL